MSSASSSPRCFPVVPCGLARPLLMGNVSDKLFFQWRWPLRDIPQPPPSIKTSWVQMRRPTPLPTPNQPFSSHPPAPGPRTLNSHAGICGSWRRAERSQCDKKPRTRPRWSLAVSLEPLTPRRLLVHTLGHLTKTSPNSVCCVFKFAKETFLRNLHFVFVQTQTSHLHPFNLMTKSSAAA